MKQAFMKQMAKSLVLKVLRGYKKLVSPLLMPACRYLPTCSEYAMDAVELQGVCRGTLMAVGRVLRCHPFSKGGYDPVVAPPCSTRGDVHEAELCSDRVS
jgi:putative membrane protein insertion efficiency factor